MSYRNKSKPSKHTSRWSLGDVTTESTKSARCVNLIFLITERFLQSLLQFSCNLSIGVKAES